MALSLREARCCHIPDGADENTQWLISACVLIYAVAAEIIKCLHNNGELQCQLSSCFCNSFCQALAHMLPEHGR